MSTLVKPLAEWCAAAIETVGIMLIVGLALYSLIKGAISLWRGEASDEVFHRTRQRLGSGIMLGLEFLVAADIIHTVAVELTFNTMGVLAVVVLIRTFLSFTLNLELTGRWPWQEQKPSKI